MEGNIQTSKCFIKGETIVIYVADKTNKDVGRRG